MKQQRGFIFVVSLVVVMIVSLLALVIARQTAVRMRWAEGQSVTVQTRLAAQGMLDAVVVDLQNSLEEYGDPRLARVDAKGETIGNCHVLLIGRDPKGQSWKTELVPMGSRLCVNNVSVEQLAALPNMKESIAAAIVDWIDKDADVNVKGGAEQLAYGNEKIPYRPHDGAMEFLEELRWVSGVTDELYFGEDSNQNGILDKGEDANNNGLLDRGLRDLLVTDVRETALNPEGAPRDNIVINKRVPFQPVLTKLYGEERAKQLLETLRKNAPEDMDYILGRLALSKFSAMTEEETAKLFSYGREPMGRVGMLDVWTAPEEVMAAVFGSSLANNIVMARPVEKTPSLSWLTDVLSAQQLNQEGQRLTNTSWQYLVDILAFRTDGKGFTRLQAVVDFSSRQARVLSIRDVTRLGWPCPWAPLENLRKGGALDVYLTSLHGGSL